jgi:hypothetical protein
LRYSIHMIENKKYIKLAKSFILMMI